VLFILTQRWFGQIPLEKRLRKHFKTILVVLILLVAIASLFIHPFGNVKTVSRSSNRQLLSGTQIDPAVFNIMQRSCQNCHSEETAWPWYSYIAPVSWLVEQDVRDGRSHFNMSRWSEYNRDDRIQILSGIGTRVRNKSMPLPKYLLLHRDAKLNDAEIDLVYQWTRAERKRLKSGAGSTQQSAPRQVKTSLATN